MLKSWMKVLSFFLLVTMVSALVSCTPTSTPTTEESRPPTSAPEPTQALATETLESSEVSTDSQKYKVALVLPGVITDQGWNTGAYEGLVQAEDQLGVEIAYSEAVPQTDYEATFRDYASLGYNLIIAHGFEFGDSVMKIAPEFPDTNFVVVNNVVTAKNVASVEFNNEEIGYLAGVVAGLMTKTNKIGAVGGFDIPAIVRAIKGFEQGAKSVNPDVEVFEAFTQSWEDIAKGKEAGLAVIDRGADVVFEFADAGGLGVIEAAKDKDVYAIGSVRDKSDAGPETVLVSIYESVPELILDIVKKAQEGNFEGKLYRYGAAEGPIRYAGWSSVVPEDVKAKAQTIFDDVAAGKVTIEQVDTR